MQTNILDDGTVRTLHNVMYEGNKDQEDPTAAGYH